MVILLCCVFMHACSFFSENNFSPSTSRSVSHRAWLCSFLMSLNKMICRITQFKTEKGRKKKRRLPPKPQSFCFVQVHWSHYHWSHYCCFHQVTWQGSPCSVKPALNRTFEVVCQNFKCHNATVIITIARWWLQTHNPSTLQYSSFVCCNRWICFPLLQFYTDVSTQK